MTDPGLQSTFRAITDDEIRAVLPSIPLERTTVEQRLAWIMQHFRGKPNPATVRQILLQANGEKAEASA